MATLENPKIAVLRPVVQEVSGGTYRAVIFNGLEAVYGETLDELMQRLLDRSAAFVKGGNKPRQLPKRNQSFPYRSVATRLEGIAA